MSTNPRSQFRPATTPQQPETPEGQSADTQWEQMVLELIACSDACPCNPGNFDEATIAGYLSGRCLPEERDEIERAIAKSPELSECVALASQALTKGEAAA